MDSCFDSKKEVGESISELNRLRRSSSGCGMMFDYESKEVMSGDWSLELSEELTATMATETARIERMKAPPFPLTERALDFFTCFYFRLFIVRKFVLQSWQRVFLRIVFAPFNSCSRASLYSTFVTHNSIKLYTISLLLSLES